MAKITRRTLSSRGFAHIEVEERGPTPRHLLAAHKDINRKSWQQAGEYHHQENIPSRFTEAGGRRLGFRKRNAGYEARKFALYGHRDPNVFTGRTRKAAQRARIVPFLKGVTMRYRVYALNYHSGAREFRRMNTDEARRVARAHGRAYQYHMGRI